MVLDQLLAIFELVELVLDHLGILSLIETF